MSDIIRDASLIRCPSCAGSGLVPRHTQQEIDRLRAENAALKPNAEDADFYRDKAVIIAERDRLRAENAALSNACLMRGGFSIDELNDYVAKKLKKPDYAPARDPSDHLACGGAVG